MKRLLTNNITPTVGLPITSAALDLLQDEHKEILTTIVKNSFIGADDDGLAHWIVPLTGSFLSSTTWYENIVYLNGELYYMPQQTIPVVYGSSYFYIDEFYDITDPIRYTDGSYNKTLQTKQITVTSSPTSVAPSGHTYTLIGGLSSIHAAPDISNYTKFSDVTASINSALANYYTKTQIDTNLYTKTQIDAKHTIIIPTINSTAFSSTETMIYLASATINGTANVDVILNVYCDAQDSGNYHLYHNSTLVQNVSVPLNTIRNQVVMKWVGVVNAGDSISIKAVLTDPANHATIDVSSAGNGLWLELFG